MKYKYNEGDGLGPQKMILKKRTKKDSSNQWFGLFECPYCKKEFETRISSIATGKTKSCGCLIKIKASKDITNKKFGRLTALYQTDKRTNSGISFWHCKCECGNEKDIRITSLLNGETQSGGCLRRELKSNDLTGQQFGHLKAIKQLNKHDSANYLYWLCQCDCGNTCEISSHSLISGNTKTCGLCNRTSLQNELISNILSELNIEYNSEYTFEDCKNPKTGKKLKFDFYLPDYDILIEYDGEQHFEEKEYLKEPLEERQYRDNLKNEYCLKNNISLIRIPYYDKNKITKEYILFLIHNKIKKW